MFTSSVKRVLSYRSDTMSWLSKTLNLSWIEENYVQKESNHNFQVKCKSCESHIKYAKVDAFKEHIFHKHEDELNMEREMQHKHDMWKYFYLTKRGIIRCIVCKKAYCGITFSNYSLEHHLSKDHKNKKDLKPYSLQSLFWKYIDAEEVTNFYGKCTLCDKKMTLQFTSEYLLNHLKIHYIKVPRSKRKRYAQSWKYQSKKLWWLDKFFTKAEEDFRAKCEICEKNYVYIHTCTIENHVIKHKEIYNYEEYMKTTKQKKIGWKSMRFIDDNAIEIECMVCNEILPDESFINNHEIHDMEKLYSRTYWGLKYMRQLGDLAKCTICKEDVGFNWHTGNLKDHVSIKHKEDLNRRQEELKQGTAYDQAGASTSHAD
nr:PREDICTED: uncharacterized protein LOC105673276 isoform X1 [Linepithema humile]